ncbi:MAG TPA: hypothetical protein VJ734_06785, partial [Nitrosospira sp.]|nr:hypothetical protein [Nitrosospira sp.]
AAIYEKKGLLDKAAILPATGAAATTLAIAIEAASGPAPAPYGMAFRQTEGRRAQGASSTSIPLNLTTIRGDEKVLQEHGPLLVQITPDVFELRMNEVDWKMTDRASKTVRGRAPSPAVRVARTTPGRIAVSKMVERPSSPPDIQMRMVLSKDLAHEVAYFDKRRTIQLAQGVLQAADLTQGGELRLKISTKISTGRMSNSM